MPLFYASHALKSDRCKVSPVSLGESLKFLYFVHFYKPCGSVDGDADKRRLTRCEAVGVALLSDLRHRLVRCFFTFGLVVGYLEFNPIVVVVFYNLDITASVIAVIFSACCT